MKILVYSSINIDLNFHLDHIIRKGETEPSIALKKSAGGKGANQAAAIAKALGVKDKVFLAAKTGEEASWILEKLQGFGVDTSFVGLSSQGSGQAIIQIDKEGQNSIILYGGGNQDIQEEEIEKVFASFSSGDWLLINAEINNLDVIFRKAKEKGMKVAVNPSPITKEMCALELENADLIAVNEVEGEALSGKKGSFEEMLSSLMKQYPKTEILFTAGSAGSWYGYGETVVHQEIFPVEAVDTVGAGDTFLGYYLAAKTEGKKPEECLRLASKASSITVTRFGAMDAIPLRSEVL